MCTYYVICYIAMNKHWSYEGTYIEYIRYIYNAKFEPMPR